MAKEERDRRYLTDSREISGFATRFRALGFKVKLEEDKDRHYPLTLYDVRDRHLLSLGLMVGASQASVGGSARPGESIPHYRAIRDQVKYNPLFPENLLAFKWAFERAGFKTLALRADSSKYRSDGETKYDAALLIGAYTEGDQVNFVGGDCLVLRFCTSRDSFFGKYGDLATCLES